MFIWLLNVNSHLYFSSFPVLCAWAEIQWCFCLADDVTRKRDQIIQNNKNKSGQFTAPTAYSDGTFTGHQLHSHSCPALLLIKHSPEPEPGFVLYCWSEPLQGSSEKPYVLLVRRVTTTTDSFH